MHLRLDFCWLERPGKFCWSQSHHSSWYPEQWHSREPPGCAGTAGVPELRSDVATASAESPRTGTAPLHGHTLSVATFISLVSSQALTAQKSLLSASTKKCEFLFQSSLIQQKGRLHRLLVWAHS